MAHSPPAIARLAETILVAAGAAPDEARMVAHYLIAADLAGHASHGVMRVKQYVEQIRKGEIVCDMVPRTVNEGPGFAVLEGGLGFGQIGAAAATRVACDKAASQGIAIVTLRNSAHVGRLGDWVELAARAGCISFHFVNTLSMPRVAPWGGKEGRLSTNPLAWGMPVAGGDPIVVDLTTSVVAEGKVRLARNARESIPAGWIVDRDGRQTTDPAQLYDGGSLLPLGGLEAGHKGYALSLMVDLMAGALSGGGASSDTRKVNCNNFTVIAIAERQLAGDGSIAAEARQFVDWVRSATPVDAASPVRMPGEVERARCSRQLRDGLELDEGVRQALRDAAVLVGVPLSRVGAEFSAPPPFGKNAK